MAGRNGFPLLHSGPCGLLRWVCERRQALPRPAREDEQLAGLDGNPLQAETLDHLGDNQPDQPDQPT